jgi:hypothetical protein
VGLEEKRWWRDESFVSKIKSPSPRHPCWDFPFGHATRGYWAVVEASFVGTIDGFASIMIVRVLVAVLPQSVGGDVVDGVGN